MKAKWSDYSLLQKVAVVLSALVALAVIFLAILQIFEIWDNASLLYIPLLGVSILCQAYLQWDTKRKLAYFDLGVAVFIFLCAIAGFFLQ